MSFSGFVQVNAVTANQTVFSQTNSPLTNAFGIQIYTTNIMGYIRGAGGIASGNTGTLSLGQPVHIAGVLTPTGATLYIGGAVKGTASAPGTTLGGTNSVQLWTTGTAGQDFLVSDLAIWNGYALRFADVLALRDRTKNPGQISTPATSWWTCSGTPGANAAIGDPGLTDALGGNSFATITGPAAAATYSATTLNFVPPITISNPMVMRYGLFVLPIGTNPAFGSVARAYPTSVNADPVFKVNGSPVSALRAWSSITSGGNAAHQIPGIYYWPYSGTAPIEVAPTDVVTFDAPSNWIGTQQGYAAEQSGTLANYRNMSEPGHFGFSGFDVPPSWKKFRPGYLGSGTVNVTVPFKNQMHGSNPNPPSGAATYTSDGIPLTFTSAGTITLGVWSSTTNYIDSKKFAAPTGVWRLVADETLPSTPLVVSMTGSAPSVITGPVITPGTIVSGVEKGKVFTFTCGSTPDNATFNNSLSLTFTAPTPHVAGQSFSLTNMKLFFPGDTVVDPIPVTSDSSETYQRLTRVGPGRAVELVRFLGGWPSSSVCRASDPPAASNFSLFKPPAAAANTWPSANPGLTGDRYLPVYAVREYQLSVTPNIYTRTNWRRCVASDNTSVAPYMFVPAANGADRNWIYRTGSATKTCVLEFVVADSSGNPINHNAATNQFIDSFSLTLNVKNSAGTGTCTIASSATSPIAVTGPNTFIATFFGNGLATNTMDLGVANGTQVVNVNVLLSDPNGSTYEQVSAISHGDGNPGIWLCMPLAMEDNAVTSMALRVRSATPTGTKVYLQIGNENFIPSVTAQSWGVVAGIEGGTSTTNNTNPYGDTFGSVISRHDQMCTIFEGIWGSDASSIRRIFQPWTTSPGNTTSGLSYAHDQKIRIDHIAIATYTQYDLSTDFMWMGARIVADMPESIAHPSQGGDGIRVTMGQYIDGIRFYFKYSKNLTAPLSLQQQHINARNATGYGDGHSNGFTYPMPTLIGYEGVQNDMLLAGISHVTQKVRFGLSHDLSYHPAYYYLIQAIMQWLQEPGPIGTEGFYSQAWNNLCGARTFSSNDSWNVYTCPDGPDNSCTALWGQYTWMGQPMGYGLSNKYWADTPAFGGDRKTHDFENEAIAPQAIADWMNDVLGAPPAPSFTVSPSSIVENTSTPVTITLMGTNTTWTSGSTVNIINSHTGTTTVVAGTWTAASTISATLAVTCGAGVGAWIITVDGTNGPDMSVTSAPVTPTFTASPTSVTTSQATPQIVTLNGTATTWTSGSAVSITNSVSGTTTVTKGTWTVNSPTSATLGVTTGAGLGQWQIVIDGVTGPTMSTQDAPPVASFTATPVQVNSDEPVPQTITLFGTSTTWTSGSMVSIANGLSGTTNVTPGTFTAISNTSATLAVTVGPGVGTWKAVVDGVAGPTMATMPNVHPVGSTLTIVVAGLLGTQLVTQGLGMSAPVIVPQTIGADPMQGYVLIDTTTPGAADPQGGKLVV
jgi:hypothetical protein